MKEMRAAQALDPLLTVLSWDIAAELFWAGRSDDALRELKKASDLFPNLPELTYTEVLIDQQKGDLVSARRVLDALKSSQPEAAMAPVFVVLFGTQDAREGHRDAARRTLERLEALRRTEYVDPVIVLDLCTALNDAAQRRVWLKRASDERSTQVAYLRLHPASFDGDPAGEALISRVH
jgi:predicted Zn-dependent protease